LLTTTVWTVDGVILARAQNDLLVVNRPVLTFLGTVGLNFLVLGLGLLGLGRGVTQLGDARAEEPGHQTAEHRAAGAGGADLPR